MPVAIMPINLNLKMTTLYEIDNIKTNTRYPNLYFYDPIFNLYINIIQADPLKTSEYNLITNPNMIDPQFTDTYNIRKIT